MTLRQESGPPPRETTLAPHIDSLRGAPRLGDFTADRRILLLIAMAVIVGCLGAAAAIPLLWGVIKTIQNALALFQ